ncbi:unnamed protein product [Urochloa decumbens]|uniref:Ubiquitin-like protease family profile domain-containing protein n=1 Tax=Urochloa decumbens TaxID=240449 RepID=A0ABC8VJD2_9POAL
MPHVNQNQRDGLDDSYKEFDEDFDDQSDDDDSCDERQSQREQEPSLQMLDDDVLFGFLKKMACTAFRQLITSAVGPSGFEISVDNVVNTTSCGTSDARVTGIPLGGRPIRKSDSEKGKRGFLGMLKLTSLPTVKAFGDKLLKDDISDEDELVRSFLIVALATFLCPNASPYPSTEYLLPLVAVKSAEKWDWSKFVHYWLFKQIHKYHSRKKKPQHQTRTLGGCLYLICVAYLDFLAFGPHDQLPSTLPRITVWKKDMIKQFSELDRVDGNVFGKRPILPLKSTCFARKVASRTPSPVCIPDGSNFKKVLLERVPANFSPETLDDVTALYMKHVSAPIDTPSEYAQNIILDIIQYFYHRSQIDKSPEHNQSTNNGETIGSKCALNNELHDISGATGNCHGPEDHFFDGYNDNVLNDGVSHIDEPEESVPSVIPPTPAIANNGAPFQQEETPYRCSHSKNVGDPIVHGPSKNKSVSENDHTPPALHDNVVVNDQASGKTDCNPHGANTEPPLSDKDNGIMSGDTEIVPSSGNDTQSQHLSIAETEKISSSSPDLSNSGVLSQGNKRSFSDTVADAVGHSVAGCTRTRPNSMSPRVPLSEIQIKENPEGILRNNRTKRLVTRKRKSLVCPSEEVFHVDDDIESSKEDVAEAVQEIQRQYTDHIVKDRHNKFEVDGSNPEHRAQKITCQRAQTSIPAHAHDGALHKIRQLLSEVLDKNSNQIAASAASATPSSRTPVEVRPGNSASFDHLLTADISSHGSRHLDPPSVNTRVAGSSGVLKEKSAGIGPSNCIKMFESKVSASEKLTLWDFPVPSFSLGIDFDDDKPVPNQEEMCQPTTGARNFSSTSNHSSSAKSVMYLDKVKSRHNKHLNCGNSVVRGTGSSDCIDDDDVRELRPDDVQMKPIKFDTTPTPDLHFSRAVTPQPIPLIVINSQGKATLNAPPQSPEVLVTGQRFVETKGPPEVAIIWRIQFQDQLQQNGQHPRRSRHILKPNSYYRNFQISAYAPRVNFFVHEKLAYDCLIFYSSLPEYAKGNVINYGNVFVTYHELWSSLRRSEKTGVHIHVMNAFCRKLFKDRHPNTCGKHYFFSTVGDYLIGKKGNQLYQHDNCHKCFEFANKCFSFLQSDFLFFPIFNGGHWFVFIVAIWDGYFVFLDPLNEEDDHYQEQARAIIIPNFVKAWDEFIGYNCDFEQFVIHYAPVPKLDRKFQSMYDDGIFVMKYLEMWDPYVNMSKHNQMNDAKELLSNFDAMVKLKNSTLQARSLTVS